EYHGQIIGLSQRDRSIFGALKVIGQRRVFWGLFTIYKVSVPPNELETIIRRLQENMSNKLLFLPQEYYAHFYRGRELIIVYRDRVFRVTTDPATWKAAIEHGRELGIAERQLDFSPHRVEDERY
ncbi:MAG: hypothetical protein ABSE69_10625, partial [Roseiarcus sp.]